MCNSNNSNQEKLNQVVSQMTALTNAIDELREEVNAMKLKSHLIQNKILDNELAKTSAVEKRCRMKKCFPSCDLEDNTKGDALVAGDHEANVASKSEERTEKKWKKQKTPKKTLEQPPNDTVSDFKNHECVRSGDKNNKDRKNKRLDSGCTASIAPSAIDESDDSARNTSKAKKGAKGDQQKQKTLENLPARQEVDPSQETVVENDQQTESKRGDRKSAKVTPRMDKQKKTPHSKDVVTDEVKKSQEMPDSSSTGTKKKQTPSCMDSFKQSLGSCCGPSSKSRKKPDDSKSVKKEQEMKESKSDIPAVKEDTLVAQPVNDTNDSNEKRTKNRGKSKKLRMAEAQSPSTTTVDTNSSYAVDEPVKTVKKTKVIDDNKKQRDQKNLPSPSSSVTTVDTQSNNSVGESSGTSIDMRPRNIKKKDKPKSVTTQCSCTSTATKASNSSIETESQADRNEKRKAKKNSRRTQETQTQEVEKSESRNNKRAFKRANNVGTKTSLSSGSRSSFGERNSSQTVSAGVHKCGTNTDDGFIPSVCQREKKPEKKSEKKPEKKPKKKNKNRTTPTKNKGRSKCCGPGVQCRPTSNNESSARPYNQQDNSGMYTEVYPLFHHNTYQTYHVSPSISKSGPGREYPFANPTSYPTYNKRRFHFPKIKYIKKKEKPFLYEQEPGFHHPPHFVPNVNHVSSQFNSLAVMTSDSSETLDDTDEQIVINRNESSNTSDPRAAHLRTNENQYFSENRPFISVSPHSSHFSLGNAARRKSHLLNAREPSEESPRPALLQRFAKYFFSKKSTQYVYAGCHPYEKPPTGYIYKSSPPTLGTPQSACAEDVSDTGRYEYMSDAKRISHDFDESQNMYTLMPVLMGQKASILGGGLQTVKVSERPYARLLRLDDVVAE